MEGSFASFSVCATLVGQSKAPVAHKLGVINGRGGSCNARMMHHCRRDLGDTPHWHAKSPTSEPRKLSSARTFIGYSEWTKSVGAHASSQLPRHLPFLFLAATQCLVILMNGNCAKSGVVLCSIRMPGKYQYVMLFVDRDIRRQQFPRMN